MLTLFSTLAGTIVALLLIATIGFGAIGFLAPRFTMKKLDLAPDGSTLGYSEIRAANGALFIGLGLAALLLGSPVAVAMVGFAYAGAAIGRAVSIIWDKSGALTSWSFLTTEIAFAGILIWAGLIAPSALT